MSVPVNVTVGQVEHLHTKVETQFMQPDVQKKLTASASIGAYFNTRVSAESRLRPSLAQELQISMEKTLLLAHPSSKRPLTRGAEVLLGIDDSMAFTYTKSRFPAEEETVPLADKLQAFSNAQKF